MTVFRAGENYSDPLDFCGRSLGIVSGSVPVEQTVSKLRAACMDAGRAELRVATYSDQTAMLIAVLSGRNDGAVLSSASALYIAETQARRLDAFQVETDIFGVGVYSGLGIPATNRALGEAVLAAMTSLLKSGEYRAIFETYGLADLTVDAMSIASASSRSP